MCTGGGAKGRAPVVGVLGCMAERLKHQLLDQDKLVDVVAGPDAYRDLPSLIQAVDGQRSLASSQRAGAINVQLSVEETYADVVPVRGAGVYCLLLWYLWLWLWLWLLRMLCAFLRTLLQIARLEYLHRLQHFGLSGYFIQSCNFFALCRRASLIPRETIASFHHRVSHYPHRCGQHLCTYTGT